MKTFDGFSRDSVQSNDGHSNKVMALKFLPGDRNMFVTGGWDNQLKVGGLNESLLHVHVHVLLCIYLVEVYAVRH